MGFTAYDILEVCPKDFKNLEIQLLLMNADTKTGKKGIYIHLHPPPPSTNVMEYHRVSRPRKHNCFIRFLKWIGSWFKHKGDWLEEMRGNLSLVSTVISTITFQALINPPGGFIQQGLSQKSNDSLNCTIVDNNQTYCPGEAISSFHLPDFFQAYVICNTISFMSSLSVTLLLVSGVPMKNKAMIWMLSIGMCIVLTSLAAAYFVALRIVMPDHLRHKKPVLILVEASFLAWAGLLVLILVLITLRLLIWLVKICVRTIKKILRCCCCT